MLHDHYSDLALAMWLAADHNTHQLIDGQFARPTASHDGAELIERRKVKPFGIYTLVRFRRAERQATAA
jgi:hypothetical protein